MARGRWRAQAAAGLFLDRDDESGHGALYCEAHSRVVLREREQRGSDDEGGGGGSVPPRSKQLSSKRRKKRQH